MSEKTSPPQDASTPHARKRLWAGVCLLLGFSLFALIVLWPPVQVPGPAHSLSLPISDEQRPGEHEALAAIPEPPQPDAALTPNAALIWTRIVAQSDHQSRAFAILDKQAAQLFVFSATGELRSHTPVLLGAATGDESAPGIGNKPIAAVLPEERTTPAGRFVVEPGVNHQREDVVWIDYDAAVSMHRLRASAKPAERRPQRLASPTPTDNRISYGCVNVPPSFYDSFVAPTLGREGGVVYILPETRSLPLQFPALFSEAPATPT